MILPRIAVLLIWHTVALRLVVEWSVVNTQLLAARVLASDTRDVINEKDYSTAVQY